MPRKKCIIVCGPTGIGKTRRALELSSQYNTSIISADSRQCYKELNIGVAKPSEEELRQTPHYFINSHSIHFDVNAKIFEQFALKAVNEIFKSKDTAIMAGGTGLYIKAFAEGLDDIPETDKNIRREIHSKYESLGMEWLKEEIRLKDKLFFLHGEMYNPHRMMRALEVISQTGKSLLNFQSDNKKTRQFQIEYQVMELPREELYSRINFRVEKMMQDGLLNEVESLFPHRHLKALQTVGYRELFDHLEGKQSLTAAVEEIKKNTRRYAKRQITWFKKFGVNPP